MHHNASSNQIASYKSAVAIERSRHRKQKLTSKLTSQEKKKNTSVTGTVQICLIVTGQ